MSTDAPAPIRHTLSTTGGDTLALVEWPVPDGGAPRGVVQMVHGLGEHIGRYAHVAQRLNDWGFVVRGHDHFGHGQSSGPRGGLPSDSRLVDDLTAVVDDTRRAHPQQPLILLGHSLGGLVAASFVARDVRPVDGLVLSSPALDPGFSVVQRLLLGVLPRLAPDLRIGNGLDATKLAHDDAVVAAYLADPLNHDRVSGRLARFLATEGTVVQARAPSWPVPTLLLYAGDDHLVRPAGSGAFAHAALPSHKVQSQRFDDLYHEIFNEPAAAPVFEALRVWLDRAVPNVPSA